MSTEVPEDSGNTVKVLLIEDERIHREYIVKLIEANPKFNLMAIAGNGNQALLELEAEEVDLVIADHRLDQRGLFANQLARIIRERYPNIRILFWSGYVKQGDIEDAQKAGAHGYVNKCDPDSVLLNAIDNVMRGKEFWTDPEPEFEILTPMQTKIVKLFVKYPGANSNKELAKQLLRYEYQNEIEEYGEAETERKLGNWYNYLNNRHKSSIDRVEAHFGAILRRLGLRNRTELMVWALPTYGSLALREGQYRFSQLDIAVFAKFIETRLVKKTAEAFYLKINDINDILKKFGYDDPDQEIAILIAYAKHQSEKNTEEQIGECTTEEKQFTKIEHLADSLKIEVSEIKSVLKKFNFI
ncbi:MAG: response regulator transcription factor [Nitrosomonas sp.]|nr:response regulator transcription factor [Nitrosomonas sp.]